MTPADLDTLSRILPKTPRMPLLFIGHGSPMNAIEDNNWTSTWKKLGRTLPLPKAIIVISAHWLTNGTKVDISPVPKMIYDMYGFPPELYHVTYPAIGNPELAHWLANISGEQISTDHTWGLDHGAWSVLLHLYPDHDIPVFQLSLDITKNMEEHVEVGKSLRLLREHGVLIIGSGNIVHNLRAINWAEHAPPYAWATSFDQHAEDAILQHHARALITLAQSDEGNDAHPTPDHLWPLLSIIGASDHHDRITFPIGGEISLGSISMRTALFE